MIFDHASGCRAGVLTSDQAGTAISRNCRSTPAVSAPLLALSQVSRRGSHKRTIGARVMAPMKVWAHRSWRVWMRRQSSSMSNMNSTFVTLTVESFAVADLLGATDRPGMHGRVSRAERLAEPTGTVDDRRSAQARRGRRRASARRPCNRSSAPHRATCGRSGLVADRMKRAVQAALGSRSPARLRPPRRPGPGYGRSPGQTPGVSSCVSRSPAADRFPSSRTRAPPMRKSSNFSLISRY